MQSQKADRLKPNIREQEFAIDENFVGSMEYDKEESKNNQNEVQAEEWEDVQLAKSVDKSSHQALLSVNLLSNR